MFRNSLFFVALAAILLAALPTRAQSVGSALPVAACASQSYTGTAPQPLTQTLTGALCVNATVTATANTTVAAQSTLPTLSAGTQTPTASLAGAQYVQPVFGSAAGGGTQVDATHGLPVACLVGCSAASPTAFGAAFPANGTAIGFIDPGGLLAGAHVDGSGNQLVAGTVNVGNFPASQVVSGTVAATQSGTWNIGTLTSITNPVAVTGTFFQTTQPVSIAAAVAVTGTFFQTTQPVSGTFFQATQPVSAASLPLPSGASTSAKQPALGVAGTPSTDVLTVQGAASGTPLPVSGTFFQATQPVSGTLAATQSGTWNIGTVTTLTGITNPVAVTGTFFQATQPVSGTVTANQGGTWTVQPGNTANTTAWKVDGSAVTQPISGTVTANQGSANATPWNENLAQFGGTSITQGQKVAASSMPTVPASDWVTVDPTFKTLRISSRPFELLGVYSVNGNVAYTATTANGEIFSFRWGDATRLCVLLRVRVQVVATAFTTAGLVERQLVIARAFTVADSAGTALTPTTNNAKHRTSFPTSLVSDVRIGGFLTAGTHTLDANPVASAIGWMPAVGNVIGAGNGLVTLYDATNETEYPIVFATSEGFVIRLGAAETASTRQTFVSVDWAEVNAY